MKQFVYSSHRSLGFLPNLIFKMLEEAQKHNENHNITGLLIYGNNHFLQVIEGEDDVITALTEGIICDPRHYDIVVHYNREITSRTFTMWKMSFVRLESSSQKRRSSEYLKKFSPNAMNAEQALELLIKMEEHLHQIEHNQLGKSLSMLCVDHQLEMKNLLDQQLKNTQHVLNFFTSGTEALLAIENGMMLDLVIYENQTLDLSGLAFIKKFRQMKPDIPILIVSNDTDDPILTECLEIGADGYLFKPYTFLDLKTAIREAILNQNLNNVT